METNQNQDWFETLFKEHYNSLYRLACKLTGNHQNAEDIVQEAFLKGFENRDKFRGESSPYTWLYKITLNCSYRHLSRIKKLPVQLLAESQQKSEEQVFRSLPVTDDSENPLLVAEMKERCLNGFMRCLPFKQRIAFTLRVILGLSLRNSAEIMETTQNNVKVLTHRARKFMQELHENRCSLINPANPCQCKIWVAYALQRGSISQREAGKVKQPELIPQFDTEVGILHRIETLHKKSGSEKEYSQFVKALKKLTHEKKLKILS